MEVYGQYNDGTSERIYDYTYSPTEQLTLADSRVYVYSNGFSTDFQIFVTEKEEINMDVTTYPTKMEYQVGESFDPTGMVVTMYYADGTSEEVGQAEYGYDVQDPLQAGTPFVYVFSHGWTDSFSITVSGGEPTLTNIFVNSAPDIQHYGVGEYFDPTGLEIVGQYSDGSSEVITDYTFTPDTNTPLDTEGIVDVVITYQGLTCSTNIYVTTVAEAGMTIDATNVQTQYTEGESFDPTNLIVTVNYIDGTSAQLTSSEYEIWVDNPLTTSSLTATVYYHNFVDYIYLTVTGGGSKTINFIVSSTAPTKVHYGVGQTFDPTGMVITAYYTDGSSEAVNGWTYSVDDPLVEGETDVIISYEGFTCQQVIYVTEKEETSMLIAENPTKTTYVEGESFDPTGLVVRVFYTEPGDYADLSSDEYTIAVDDPLTTESSHASIYHSGFFENVNITVNPQ